ncbi:MAG: GNAT family N-acetyltransferase [Alphaproteobacteria bacterium]|nr:GNAT family N-acetyltransferase [Alphaproteobacteria bacterium]
MHAALNQGPLDTIDAVDTPPRTQVAPAPVTVTVSERIEDVEAIWRVLSAGAIESPGQSYDFIAAWVRDRRIAPSQQRYIVGSVDGVPVALLPLHRKRVFGLPIFTWFPGAHAGCYAPVADYARLAGLGAAGRRALWAAMTGCLSGGDVVYLRSIPTEAGGQAGLFDELGTTLAVETLYRSRYPSWTECDRLQRCKSRRKHDRQQGDRLSAMGAVSFEEIGSGGDTEAAIATMFAQRSARFKAMGIRDTFVLDGLIGFYQDLARAGSGVDVRLHVLRLDGAIVAVRYNIVHGDRMFCLISSMSDDPAIQNGSPGKQCLLNVMQTVFDSGTSVFDMGSGYTDEKRHWCNEQIPLQQHYIGLNAQGQLIVAAHQAFQRTRARIKANPQLKSAVRSLRQVLERLRRRNAAPAAPVED